MVILRKFFWGLICFWIGLDIVSAGVNQWTRIGPDGGYVYTVAIDPSDSSILYAGTNSGGIFKSVDAGANWSLASNGIPFGAWVWEIAIDPLETNRLYAGTTHGLYRSIDSGTTWSHVTEAGTQWSHHIIIDPSNPNIVYANSDYAGFFRSSDRGQTWTEVSRLPSAPNELIIDPDDSNRLYAAFSSLGVYISVDGGANWSASNVGLAVNEALELTIQPSLTGDAPSILTVSDRKIYRSTDKGVSWQVLYDFLNFPGGRYAYQIVVDPDNPSVFYGASENGGVLKSSNSGTSWTSIISGFIDPYPDISTLTLDVSSPVGNRTVYAGAAHIGIYKSLDSGESWSPAQNGLKAMYVSHLDINPVTGDLFAATPAGLYRTPTANIAWTYLDNGFTSFVANAILVNPLNPSMLLAGYAPLHKSLDNGDTWVSLDTSIGGVMYDLAVSHTDTAINAVFALKRFGGVAVSYDEGDTWGPLPSSPSDTDVISIAVHPTDQLTIFVGSSQSGLYKTVDGGVNWTNSLTNQRVYDIVFHPSSPSIVYAGASGNLYKSTNTGDTWVQASSSPSLAGSNTIEFDPVNPFIIYVGTGSGVFKSVDDGVNWGALNDGLNVLAVNDLLVDPVDQNIIYAGTVHGGVFSLQQQNRPPVAVGDSYTVNENATLTVPDIGIANILFNDTDPDIGNSLSVEATPTTAPIHGTLILNSDGSFSYTHDGSETTSDSFTYVVSDGALTSTATVTITVNPVNDPPVANPDSYNGDEGATLMVNTTNGVLANDTDADINPADTLTVSSTPVTAPVNGALSLNADGSFTYIHNGSETTNDSFVYQMSDGTEMRTETVTLTINPINDPPTAVDDSGYSVNEGEVMGVIAPGLLGNDTDAENDPLTIDLTPVSGPASGALSLSADGSFTYAHDGSETTSDSFVYTVTDSLGASSTATVAISITPVNDPPVAVNDSYNLDEGATLAVDSSNGVLINDTDVDINPQDTLTVSSIPARAPLYGTLTLSTDGSFTYNHDGSETTSDSFQYQMSDGSATSIATVTLAINPMNDPPLANMDSYSLDEGATLNINAANGVLANDSDAENDPLAVSTTLVSNPSNGSVNLNADGSFTYTHNGDETRSDSFQYQLSDGADTEVGTVNITINPVNDPPVANADSYSVDEGTNVAISAALGLLANDTDSDLGPQDILTVNASPVSAPLHGILSLNTDGSFTYTHDGTETTNDSFQYQMSDGSVTRTATVTLTINPVNDPPVAVNDSGYSVAEGATLNIPAPGLLSNDSDVENNALTVSTTPVSAPANGTLSLNSDGSFSYTHDGSETSNDSFDYQISDGAANANAGVSIAITPVNDAPVANNDSFTTDEDTDYTGQLSGSDAENSGLNYAISSFPSKGSITLEPSTGLYTYSPNANANGADAFTFTANDGQLSSLEATVTISITPINDLPVASDDTILAIEDTPANGVVTVSDVDSGDTPSYRIDTAPSLGTVNLNSGTGAYTYTPNANQTGSDFFTFIVNDGTGDSSTARIDITIQALQDQPLASGGSLITDEDTAQSGQLIAVDADPLDVLSYEIDTAATQGSINLDSATGAFTYIPNANYYGTDSFSFTASDGTNTSEAATINIVISPVNDAPVASNGQLNTSEDTAAQNQMIATDVDQDSVTYSLVNPPSKGALQILNAINGTYRYTPNANQTGLDGFSFKVSDGQLESNVATVAINIGASNDAPVANPQHLQVDEDSIVDITLTGSDADNETLSYAIETPPSRGSLTGSAPDLTYVPAADYYGTDSFVFSVTDPNNASHNATVTIAVNAKNDVPVAQSSSLRVEQDTDKVGTLIATDVDGNPLSYSVVAQGEKGQVEIIDTTTGEYTYRPNPGAVGHDQFSYVVNDGTTFSAAAAVKININALGNEAPSIPQLIAPASTGTVEGTTATFTWERAQDSNGDLLSYELVYCDNPEFTSCAPIQVTQANRASVTYLALGSSSAGIILLGLMGAPRRRMLAIIIMIASVIVLGACSDAANQASTPPTEKPTVPSISYTVNGLSAQTTYYWKVVVDDNRGGVVESVVRSFNTM
jgi:VCBS repeat-containing protein